MSKIALSPSASGTGTLTIAAPNTNSDRTLTLPDNSGTLLSNASTAGFPAGSVLQVVQGTSEAETSTTSTSFVSTPLAASITPSSSSSKILVQYVSRHWVGGTGEFVFSTIYRNSTEATGTSNGLVQVYANDAIPFISTGACLLDAPSTTSSTTYTVYIKTFGGGTGGFGSTNAKGVIILMEIAA